MEGEATAEGAVAKVSRVRYSLPRSYAWVRTAEGTARRVIVLWDTGATHTIINPKIVADLNLVVKKGQGPTLLSMTDDHTQKCSSVVENLQILAGQFLTMAPFLMPLDRTQNAARTCGCQRTLHDGRLT
jgi:hypothetical protein